MNASSRVGASRVHRASAGLVGSATKLFKLSALLVAFTAAGNASSKAAYADSGKSAETLSLSGKYAAYDAALRQTLLKPSDVKALATFATIAVEIGDLEGAISALERLLLISGDLPDVKLELGVLYFRLGSFETARVYLRSAFESPNATALIKDRANQYLKARKKT